MISDRSLRVVLRSDRAVHLWGDLVRAATIAGVTILIVLAGLYQVAGARMMMAKFHMNDFGKFYYSARYFLNGYDMYLLSPATTMPGWSGEPHQLLNMNPPHFHLLILPLARLAPGDAMPIWSLMGLVGLLWSAWLITRELHVRWTPIGALWSLLAFLVCSPTGAVVFTGQVTFLLLPLITLAWIAARRRSWVRAGLLLGIVAGIKPHLGLFGVFFLVAGQWRAAVAMASTVIGSFTIGLLVFGWETHLQWIGVLRAVDWKMAPMNGAIAGFFARVPEIGGAQRLIPAPVLTLITVVVCLAVAGVSLRLVARRSGRMSVDRFFGLTVLTAQLVSPLGWVYYLWLAAGPLLAMWRTRARQFRARDAALWLALPGLLWPLPLFAVDMHAWWQPFTFRSIYFWTTLSLWLAVVLEVGRTTSGPRSAPDSPHGS